MRTNGTRDRRDRLHELLLALIAQQDDLELMDGDGPAGFSVSGGGEAASPWTRVTNCTQGPDIQPREPSPAEREAQLERLKAWQSSEIYRVERDAEYEDAIAAREAARKLFAPSTPYPQEEYFPPELC